jgi:uncharacterized protein
MDILTAILIFGTGILGGLANGITGTGSALIIIPLLLFLGIPPHIAISSFKFGALGGIAGQTYKYNKAGVIVKKYLPILFVCAITGGFIGANILVQIPENLLKTIIGILILASLPLVFTKKIGLKQVEKSSSSVRKGYIAAFFISIFDGLSGIMVGAIATITFIKFFGLTIIQTNAIKQLYFLFSVLVTIIVLYFAGHFNLVYSLLLFAGMLVGGYVGAHTAIKKGNKFVQSAFIVAVALAAVKLLFF